MYVKKQIPCTCMEESWPRLWVQTKHREVWSHDRGQDSPIQTTINSKMFIVWFQKISIPPPQRKCRASSLPSSLEFPIFQHKNYPPSPPPNHLSGVSASAMHTPVPSGKKLVLAGKCGKHSKHLTVCILHICCLFLIHHNIWRYTKKTKSR